MFPACIRGAIAGLAATAPMTIAMQLGFRQLPRWQKYPLPPRQITARVCRDLQSWQYASENEKQGATLTAHFGYGAAMGAVYGQVVPQTAQGPITGAIFGLSVWTASYLGALPELGILRSAKKHPAERNALMIAAHLVWGTALGVIAQASSDVQQDYADS